jgi:DNA polymerase-3 subunit gamma/tau
VEYIRDIREEVVYTPAMLKNRVYIIDEVHMLSQSAFNALLKTLEEPPERVIFILATTELHKIPPTILSRCQRFDFRRLRANDIAEHLSKIAQAEGIQADRDALFRIARLAQGGMRDAISMLELCAAGGKAIDVELVQQTAGVSGFEMLYETVKGVCRKDYEAIFEAVDKLYRTSRDPAVFLQDLIGFYRDMLVVRTAKHPEKYLELSERELEQLQSVAGELRRESISAHSRILEEAFTNLSYGSADKRLILETALLRLCDDRLNNDIDGLIARIAALEDAVAAGGGILNVQPAQPASAPLRSAEATADTKQQEIPSRAMPEKPKSAPVRAEARRIPDFIEAVKAVEQSDVSAASILKLATATLRGEETVVEITVENEFYRMMLDRDPIKQTILRALGRLDSLQGISLTGVSILLGKRQKEEKDSLPDLDELN